MQVDHIGALRAQCRSEVPVGASVPDDHRWQRRLPGLRPTGDIVAASLESDDFVPKLGERGALLVNNAILTTRRR
jgi:hypothetical protein